MYWGPQFLDVCGLKDLGFEGYPFTWSNGRQGNENIRLDRVVDSTSFIHRFSPIKVLHVSRHGSDRATIRVDLEAILEEDKKKRKFIFRFEESWTKDPRYEKLMGQLWNGNKVQGH